MPSNTPSRTETSQDLRLTTSEVIQPKPGPGDGLLRALRAWDATKAIHNTRFNQNHPHSEK